VAEARSQAERDLAGSGGGGAAGGVPEGLLPSGRRAEPDAVPLPLDGAVAYSERLTNARRPEWMDPWGARGSARLWWRDSDSSACNVNFCTLQCSLTH
jgi:hypothetical protein